MTDSNLALMYKLDSLPTASVSSNYQDEEAIAEKTKSINANIDETQKRTNEYFDSLIKMYNALHERDQNRPKEFIAALKSGRDFKNDDNVKAFGKYLNNYIKWGQKYKEHKDFVTQDGNIEWATYEGKGSFDPDVKKEIEMEAIRKQTREEASDAGHELGNQNNELKQQLLTGPNQVYIEETEQIKDIDQLLTHIETVGWPRARAGMKILMPGQFTAEGKQIYKTYDEMSASEKEFGRNVINAWFAHKNEDMARNRFGFWKRRFIVQMHENDEVRVKKELETEGAALAEIQKQARFEELQVKLSKDPGFFIDWINIHKGAYGGDYALARKAAVDIIIEGIEGGYFDEGDINPLLDHWFEARDSTPEKPHRVQFSQYWKKDARRIRKALSDEVKKTNEENKQILETERETKAKNRRDKLVESGVPITYQTVQELIRTFMQEEGITDPELVPDSLKNLPYEGFYTDQELDDRLNWNHHKLNQQITKEDLIGITDPDLKKKWMDIVESGSGLSKEETSRRNRAVTAEVTRKTMETDVNKAKTPKWTANYENAIEAYNSVYNGIIDKGGSSSTAHKEAMEYVESGLEGNKWNTRGGEAFDPAPAKQVNKIVKSIGQDRNLINSTDPWEGEEKHLIEALEYVEKSKKGIPVDQPYYYEQIAKLIGMNPEKLIRNRLEVTGATKDKTILPEEQNLKPVHQKLLLKPSASKTYRVTKENEDIVWMLDTIASPDAEKNGGYNAIKNTDGDYENIEEVTGKKIGEITFGDIAVLIENGYTNLGRYDLTPKGFIDIVVANGLSKDTPFDQKGQDLIVLGRLRQKAQSANSYRTLNARYRRLVNIPQQDQDEFLEIVGDLPPWLQLDTLLPEVAKELVRSTLQQ